MLNDIKSNNWFLYALLLGCFLAVGASFYFFYVKQDYEFTVEVACDPTLETCIQRDCSNPDDCPPNGLSDFKRYSLSASDFDQCENEDCKIACETNLIPCVQQECVEDDLAGEVCSAPEVEEPIEEENMAGESEIKEEAQ